MSKKPRIMIGRFYHESNRLNPQPTTRERFIVDQGDAIIANASGTLLGISRTLQQRGAILLPTVSIAAPPGGLVDHIFYEWCKSQFLESVDELAPDAIALELHGAMGTTLFPDAEGDLLAALRCAAGKAVPIAIGLDLHAHLTDKMIANTDISCACKENPHSDTVECGVRVGDLLMEKLTGRLTPITTVARLPMILPGAGETTAGPLQEIHLQARDLTTKFPVIRDISIYNVFRFTDDDDIGQVVTVTTDGHDTRSIDWASELVEEFWIKKERFTDKLLSLDEAFAMIERTPSAIPFVLGDMGDRVLAGAPGDSVAILSKALERGGTLRGAISITDPSAAAKAKSLGIGATVTLSVGGGITPGFTAKQITGKILHVSDGTCVLKGPFQGGETCALGPSAVVLADERLYVLLTSLPAYGHDPAIYSSQGIDLATLDFAVAKSGYHFTLNYSGLATPVLVATPGVGYYEKGQFSYNKSRFWPEHDIDPFPIHARVFTQMTARGPA